MRAGRRPLLAAQSLWAAVLAGIISGRRWDCPTMITAVVQVRRDASYQHLCAEYDAGYRRGSAA